MIFLFVFCHVFALADIEMNLALQLRRPLKFQEYSEKCPSGLRREERIMLLGSGEAAFTLAVLAKGY